ncbi:uncharacterized protein LAESUDRAFT_344201 [Laetiporus sulphureus 93-53]|uniref:Uncharacterized protein n=1 Tax=Laetiporus sulphureus 93-53 TaxID=1314785 RepID=A0A165GQK5_9APHY|nr:uncharacterized protein LAESUDRAFT_344201 [Laetiporus sulphureus 93-53]KZT10669.1 hypothetical protein LAESUDRAFT_344201 [Laetiporus sulphureus 93-53]
MQPRPIQLVGLASRASHVFIDLDNEELQQGIRAQVLPSSEQKSRVRHRRGPRRVRQRSHCRKLSLLVARCRTVSQAVGNSSYAGMGIFLKPNGLGACAAREIGRHEYVAACQPPIKGPRRTAALALSQAIAPCRKLSLGVASCRSVSQAVGISSYAGTEAVRIFNR